jgi:carbamoyltransferase
MTKLEDYSNSVVVSIDGANHNYEPNYPISFSGLVIRLVNNNILDINPALFYGGAFYSLMASSIGLSEGKLMGLSAYAESLLTTKQIKAFIKIIESIDLRKKFLELSEELSNPNLVKFNHKNIASLDKRKLPDNKKIAVAANAQRIFEYYYVNFLQDIITKFKPKNLLITGGCALNCPSNSILKKKNLSLNLVIDNSCNDEGISNGCAQVIRYINEKTLPKKNNSPYLGEYINNLDVLLNSSIIDSKNYLLYRSMSLDFYAKEIVDELLKNKIGIFIRGRYEIGPRALLNRSIIGRSDIADNHFIINKIKSREPWRPIAPCSTPDYFDTFFDGPQNPYMLMTQKVKNPKLLPAITHVDGSARCQVISNDNLIYLILEILVSKNIPPVLVNTSFNSKDEPIINDAFRAFDFFNQFDEFGFIFLDDALILKKSSH